MDNMCIGFNNGIMRVSMKWKNIQSSWYTFVRVLQFSIIFPIISLESHVTFSPTDLFALSILFKHATHIRDLTFYIVPVNCAGLAIPYYNGCIRDIRSGRQSVTCTHVGEYTEGYEIHNILCTHFPTFKDKKFQESYKDI